jgi:hypothetical protein
MTCKCGCDSLYASAEADGREAGQRIFGELVGWMVENGPAVKAAL